MTAPGETTPSPPAAEPPRERRPRAKILIAFLAVFVTLIVVFRAVLFPFLMAMFIAYLVEPVVRWISGGKRLGVRVSRGPAVVLLYLVVLGAVGVLGFYGFHKVDALVRSTATTLKAELSQTAEKARFVLMQDGKPVPASSSVDIPKGTRVAYEPPPPVAGEGAPVAPPASPRAVYRTWYRTHIDVGDVDDQVLLEPTKEEIPLVVRGNALLDEPPNPLPEGVSLVVEPMPRAKGLEVFVERHVIEPLSKQVESVTGSPLDAGFLRRAIASESEHASGRLASWLVAGGGGLFGSVIGSVYTFILVLMLAAFMIVDRARIASFFASLPPPTLRPQYETLMGYVDRGLAGVIRGQLLICLVNGLLTWLGLLILGIRHAEVLALIAGVFSLIPVFGTIASSIPIVFVALATGGIASGLSALAWICFIHLLEANLFNPLIMGSHAEMHPVVIVFALLAGEHAFGVWGALLAVPTASLVQSCFKYYRHEVEGVPPEPPPKRGRWIRTIFARRASKSEPPAVGPGGSA